VSLEKKILLIGYGNPARGDDGLGPAVSEAVEAWKLPHVTVDSAYQLTVEDAAGLAEYDVVIFADASLTAPDPFSFEPVALAQTSSFSSHSVEPGAVMALARELFKVTTAGYVLGIRGHQFDMFCETLSDAAARNLAAALDFLDPILRSGAINDFMRKSPAAAGGQRGGA
jgi:hydrogenase maturation protease